MKNTSSLIYKLWIVAVVLTAVYFMVTLWSGPKITVSAETVSSEKPAQTLVQVPQKSTEEYDKHPVNIPPFDAATDAYVLSAWSKRGLTQIIDPTPSWNILPAGTVLEAQLVRRGSDIAVVTEGVIITYSIDIPAELPAESSTKNPSKSAQLLASDGKPLPRSGTFTLQESEGGKTFATEIIPALPYDLNNNFTPYPLVTITAHDQDGKLLAKTRITLPMSTEMGCKNCHTGDWRVDGKAGMSEETAYDILTVHDRMNKTDLVVESKAGKVIDCKNCHSLENKTGLNLSAAMHGWHAAFMTGQSADACYSCHPAGEKSLTRFADDLHTTKALNCTHCHGYMEDHALTLLNREIENEKPTATRLAEAIEPRLVPTRAEVLPRTPWVNLPSCAGCHDFAVKPSSQNASAFNTWTKDKSETFANSSDDADALRCTACHGAPHALYPAVNLFGRNRSNIPPMQYQSVAAPLGAYNNCAACHDQPMDMSIHHPRAERSARMISIPEGFTPKKGRVMFPHQSHKALDCQTCHHTGFEDGKTLACSQSGCHSKVPAEGVDLEDPLLHRNAFHGAKRGCQPCHLELLSQGKAAGPTQCRACHTVMQE